MKKLHVLDFLIFLLMINSPFLYSQSKGFQENVFIGKDTLRYQLLSPEKIEKDKKYPVVLFLHGSGERGTDNKRQLKHISSLFLDSANRKKFPCFVIAPQSKAGKYRWSGLRENDSIISPLVLAEQLTDQLVKDLPIDVSRIYITGLSMGGAGIWESIIYNPDKYAAAIPICGWGIPGKAELICELPIWVFHGTLDNVVKVEGSRNMVEALKKKGSLVKFTEYPDVNHDSWTPAYLESELLPWLFSQKKK